MPSVSSLLHCNPLLKIFKKNSKHLLTMMHSTQQENNMNKGNFITRKLCYNFRFLPWFRRLVGNSFSLHVSSFPPQNKICQFSMCNGRIKLSENFQIKVTKLEKHRNQSNFIKIFKTELKKI